MLFTLISAVVALSSQAQAMVVLEESHAVRFFRQRTAYGTEYGTPFVSGEAVGRMHLIQAVSQPDGVHLQIRVCDLPPNDQGIRTLDEVHALVNQACHSMVDFPYATTKLKASLDASIQTGQSNVWRPESAKPFQAWEKNFLRLAGDIYFNDYERDFNTHVADQSVFHEAFSHDDQYTLPWLLVDEYEQDVVAAAVQGRAIGFLQSLRQSARASAAVLGTRHWVVWGVQPDSSGMPLGLGLSKMVTTDIFTAQGDAASFARHIEKTIHSAEFNGIYGCENTYGANWRLPTADEVVHDGAGLREGIGRSFGSSWIATQTIDSCWGGLCMRAATLNGQTLDADSLENSIAPMPFQRFSSYVDSLAENLFRHEDGPKTLIGLCVCDDSEGSCAIP